MKKLDELNDNYEAPASPIYNADIVNEPVLIESDDEQGRPCPNQKRSNPFAVLREETGKRIKKSINDLFKLC